MDYVFYNMDIYSIYYYHIYNRGINREHVFFEARNYPFFLKLMDRFLSDHVDIFAYCLLSNHFHLLVRIMDVEEKSAHLPFSRLFNSYTQAINRSCHRSGPLFERPFKRKQIINGKYLYQLVCYIHLNPRHHQIGDYQTYRWSSFQTHLSSAPSKIRRKDVTDWFGSKKSFQKAHEDCLLFNGISDYIIE